MQASEVVFIGSIAAAAIVLGLLVGNRRQIRWTKLGAGLLVLWAVGLLVASLLLLAPANLGFAIRLLLAATTVLLAALRIRELRRSDAPASAIQSQVLLIIAGVGLLILVPLIPS
jgi:hypothetical protein